MTIRKHDLLAAASDDESDAHGYSSEDNGVETKGRTIKRRKRAQASDFFGLDSDEEDSASNDEEERSEVKGKKARKVIEKEPTSEDEDEEEQVSEQVNEELEDDIEDEGSDTYLDPTTKSKPLSKPLKVPKKPKKLGVIYLSSLPPYMKPMTLKKKIEDYGFGPVSKVFLAPLVTNKAVQKAKSNKRKLFGGGWIELPKKQAKICAETMNANIVGGKKGGYYHDDVWVMRYLKGFSWANLTEQINNERATKGARQRAEDARARREEKVFMEGVEAGRVADGMAKKNEEKRKRKLEALGEDVETKPQKPVTIRRRFVQNDVVKPKKSTSVGDDAKRVLGKIF
ncbi:uncharacterized protein N7483_002152 [Penicillium malachiteum]|uniref:uncharacterized protein n=1 Tax=Penicillium malachiteum TaxID=1324776 RepID=UPI002548ECFA|nr:uncharacterized protein N7483_002152 [Penicillium malachiteum]KAJ5737027.1 hypothetical protein N7483_002152 [Penicillium malachiteum]